MDVATDILEEKYIKNIYPSAENVLNFNLPKTYILAILISFTGYILWQYISCYIRRIYCAISDTKSKTADYIYNVEECPICLNEFSIPLRASCGHAYCLNCLYLYFQYNDLRWKCICPLCRVYVAQVEILYDYGQCKINDVEMQYMEKKVKQMIEMQNTDLILVKRMEWMHKNGLRILYMVFICAIFVFFVCTVPKNY